MVAAKPDCTGQKFGMLTVLGKGSRATYKKSNRKETYCYLWRLQCDCGKVIEIVRGDFDRANGRGQVSCGCKRKKGLVDNKRRPIDISGQKFGTLVAIALTGKKDTHKKPTWLMKCDCGNKCEKSLSDIRRREYQGIRINCGDRSNHPEKWLTYPPLPNPYPQEAGEILKKYLYLTKLNYRCVNSAVEDEKRDRLIRAAWIITYRRQEGEIISELHEKRIICKHLRYCSIDVFWRRKLEAYGGLLYDISGNKKQIGNTMTDVTLDDYPVIETQGINTLPVLQNSVEGDLPHRFCAKKRLKFNRC